MTRYLLATWIGSLLLISGDHAQAYEVVSVGDGGVLTGQVVYGGKADRRTAAKLPAGLDAKDRAYCSSKQPLTGGTYQVGPGGGLGHVVVWIEGMTRGKPKSKGEGVLANRGCRFVPRVQSLDVGATLRLENHDPILHNTHPIYQESKSTAFNIATAEKGQVVRKKIRRPGLMKVGCDAGHTWMRAWIYAFRHPYHAVTDPKGNFVLSDIPPGDYVVRAWHEAGGEKKANAKIEAKKTATIRLRYGK
jgi:hypothetical protein